MLNFLKGTSSFAFVFTFGDNWNHVVYIKRSKLRSVEVKTKQGAHRNGVGLDRRSNIINLLWKQKNNFVLAVARPERTIKVYQLES